LDSGGIYRTHNTTASNSGVKALFFKPDNTGSTSYRVIQPAHLLDKHNLATVAMVEPKEDHGKVMKAMAVADVVISLRISSERWAKVLESLTRWGKKVIMDVDDDLLTVSAYSPHYQLLGIEEAFHVGDHGERTPLWVDGENIDLAKNRENQKWFRECLHLADLITVSSPYLAELYSEFGPTKVVPYSIDLDVWPIHSSVWYDTKTLRLAWRGGASHYEDLMSVRKPLEQLMKRHPNLTLVMAGWCPGGLIEGLPKDRVEIYPWIGNEHFIAFMAGLGADMAFYPWAQIPFNKGKTNTAWLEWSALGVPGVYPAMTPYTEDIRHTETGLLALSAEGWFESLNQLTNNLPLRRHIGESARAEIEGKWDANDHIKDYAKLLEDLCHDTSKLPDHKVQTVDSPLVSI